MDAENKLKNLEGIIKKMDSVLVAFSGGVDSSFLLKVASKVLDGNVVALTAVSPTYENDELKGAKKLASDMGVRHIIVESNELDIPGFSQNDARRCYYCKTELFNIAWEKANELGLKHVAYGSNLDDLQDYRPGMEAAKEMKISSPLVDAKLTKKDVRRLSKSIKLANWNKPALACLSSRFPYGTEITTDKLKMVEESEAYLHERGFEQCRVRYYGDTARIEVDKGDIERFFEADIRNGIIDKFKEIGFTYVTVDLEGYRSGSLNEVLDLPTRH
ncbi:MAG: ATP-dependent sacrificial sulfur transferase LarE [Thermodesulfobacteriota bacterium]